MASKGLVTLIGGSGFIGRYTARALVKEGYRVRIACRRPHLAGDARLAGGPGWVDVVQANVRHRPSLELAMDGADAVINLVGILYERGRQQFDSSQALGAATVAEVAANAGITNFVQVSAIGADTTSASDYARTKAEAENAVREAIPSATILRPSVVFGPDDGFFNKFADLARFSPILPAIGGGETKVQPIYVANVADAIAAAVVNEDTAGQTYELGGPRTYTFNEIYDLVLSTVDRKRLKLPLPFSVMKPIGLTIGAAYRYIWPLSVGMAGAPPITGDQVEMLKTDNVVSDGALTIGDLGIEDLESPEAIVPTYLWRFRSYGEFHKQGEA